MFNAGLMRSRPGWDVIASGAFYANGAMFALFWVPVSQSVFHKVGGSTF